MKKSQFKKQEDDKEKQYETFLQDLEEDPEMRANVTLFKVKKLTLERK